MINLLSKEHFLGELSFAFNQYFWITYNPKINPLYLYFYFLFYWGLLPFSFFLLLKFLKSSEGLDRTRIKYFLIGTGIGWIGATSDFLCVFFPNFYPYLNFLIAFYPLIIGYAIIRHQLMDINIVIKKSLVYSVLIALITIFYLIIVFVLEKITQNLLGYRSLAVSIGSAFVLGLVFIPLRHKIQSFLDKTFFHGTLESLERKNERLQAELFHKEKLAYVGQLASSVAHEIRNPITTIKTYLEYLPKKYNDPEFKNKLEQLLPQEIERVEKITNHLLSLARQKKLTFSTVNIVQCIDSTLELLENHLEIKNITIKKDYASDETTIKGDIDSLKQIFLNLLLNAIQAMTESGTLSVRCSVIGVSESNPKSQTTKTEPRKPNPYISISINDTGHGIPKEQLATLFTPFKTTKKDGIGLGLSITKEIINSHGGTIEVESTEGKGTTFFIKLPTKIGT